MIMSGHPFIKALAAYWCGASVQGLRCNFISMPGKSPMKLEVTSRHDHSCLLGRKASKQTNKQTNKHNIDVRGFLTNMFFEALTCNYLMYATITFICMQCGVRSGSAHRKNNVLKDKKDFFIDKAVKLSFGLICDKTNETRSHRPTRFV